MVIEILANLVRAAHTRSRLSAVYKITKKLISLE